MQTIDDAPALLTQPMTADVSTLMQDPYAGIISAWLAEVQQRTNSQRTPADYGRYLERFRAIVPDLFRATPAHLHAFAYGTGPTGQQPSASTITVRLAALRSFFDFARRMRMIDVNPADDVKRPKGTAPSPRGLSTDELERLLAVIPDSDAGRRDRAIVRTILYTGLRRTEVLTLTAGQLSREDGRVYFRIRAKGGVERFRELPPPALQAIARYWAARGMQIEQLAPTDALFPSSSQGADRTQPVSHIGFYLNLRRYADRAGLPNVKPHDLRHSAAKLRRKAGQSIEDVQKLLGHKSIATTAIYLAQMEGADDAGWADVAALLGDA